MSERLGCLLSGRAHDWYAALAITVMALYFVYVLSGKAAKALLAALVAMLGAGIFIDMWIHDWCH